MNILSAYIQGIFNTLSKFKMVLLLYGCNLLFGLIVALPLHSVLKESIGQSFEIQRIITGFDNTVFTDFMNTYGQLLQPLLSQFQWLSVLYIALFIFLNGGIIHTLLGRIGFWEGCSKYFWRFLRLTLLFLLLHLLTAIVVFGILYLIVTNGFSLFSSEIPIYWSIVIGIIVYILLASLVSMLSDYAKIRMVKNDRRSAIQAMLHSFGTVFQNFQKTYSLYLLNMFGIALLYLIYWTLHSNVTTSNFFIIFFIILVQQFILLLRMCAKVVNLSSALEVYRWVNR
ncbi:MAG: hypothetical protein AB8B69_27400 [Chitinophagales bacterium]